jgi:hypothetical protein
MLRGINWPMDRRAGRLFFLTALQLSRRIAWGCQEDGRSRASDRLRLRRTLPCRDRLIARQASTLIPKRWLEMSDTIRSLSTSGLAPKQQIQFWSDALTDLCGRFDVDPLKASSLEARINYTTVSQLKLCQIEASQHRIAHTDWRIRSTEHPYLRRSGFPTSSKTVVASKWRPASAWPMTFPVRTRSPARR